MWCYHNYCYTLRPLIAELIGGYVGLSLWGFYVCLFVVTAWLLRKRPHNFTPALAGNILLFSLNFVQTVLTAIRGYDVFITNGQDADGYISSASSSAVVFLLYDLIFLLASIIANFILWWRLYIIWYRDRRILAVPALGMVAFFAGGSYLMALDAIKVVRPLTKAEGWKYIHCTEAMLTIDLILNWLVTIMVCWKLWRDGHRAMALTDRKSSKYLSIILALVESGMVYSVVLGVFVSTWYSRLYSVGTLFDGSLSRVMGIVPLMIMLQLGMGYERPADTMTRVEILAQEMCRAQPPTAAAIVGPRRDFLSIDVSSFSSSHETSNYTQSLEEKTQVVWSAKDCNLWKDVEGAGGLTRKLRIGPDEVLEDSSKPRRRSSDF